MTTRRRACMTTAAALALTIGCCQSSAPVREAREILDASGIRGGLIVHIGCGDARLTAALRASESYLVEGLEADERRVEDAVDYVKSRGLSGSVSISHWTRDSLPYTDNLVNLVVSENLGRTPMDEVLRVLAPNGVAYIKENGAWAKTAKPWPQEIDQWTHWLHGPDNNPVARDMRVGPPRRVQWAADPKWPKSHDMGPSMTGLVSAGGRLFYIADEGPAGIQHPQHELEQWALFARDAFNGVLLWKKPVEDWGARAWSPDDYPLPFGPWTVNPRMIHRQLVSEGDRVYVTLGFTQPISVLDAATGEVLRTLEDSAFSSEILVDAGRVHAVIDRAAQRAGKFTRTPEKSVIAIDPDSGKTVWERSGLSGIEDITRRGLDAKLTRLYLTSGGGKVFAFEEGDILALDAATGKDLWRAPRPEKIALRNLKDTHPVNDPYDLGSMFYSEGVLYCWQPHLPPTRARFWQYRMELRALSATDGKVLWKKICGGVGFSSFVSVYKAQGLVWVQSAPDYRPPEVRETYDLLGLDPATGEVVRRHSVEPIFNGAVHHHRCYQNKATEKYIIYSRNGLEYVGLDTGEIDINKWVRGMCQYGVTPANGLIYAPTQPCACFASARLSGYNAFAAEGGGGPGRAIEPSERLHRGPAYGEPAGEDTASEDDWRTYRHDAQRSGASGTLVPAQLKRKWNVRFDEAITAPTAAMGRVFVASRQSRRVYALDGRSGRELWSYQAGNRSDTPPTISGGRLYFGTADGLVHCLRASDGALVWRFDANPELRHVVSYGAVESAWPVPGSVVVQDGVVYFCAGRSSYVDGGLHFYALDAGSGEVIRSATHHSMTDEQEMEEKRARGTFNDILVYDAGSLYLKNVAVDTRSFRFTVNSWPYIPGGNLTWPGSPLSAVGGFLDESLFDRVGWILDNRLIAKMLVFNDDFAFGMNWRERASFWHENLFRMGQSKYMVFGRRRSERKTQSPSGNKSTLPGDWAKSVPARVTSLALTGNALFFAGEPWTGTPDVDAPALLAEGKSGLLGAMDASGGRLLSLYTLEAPPIWDGIAAASGRLYISTRDGRVVCLGN